MQEKSLPRYARIRRTLVKYGPGKEPGVDPPDDVLETVEWREIETNRLLSPAEALRKETEFLAKEGGIQRALDELLHHLPRPSDPGRKRNPLQ